ncbi:OB-fold nucleic acid binding domain-containing protein, partial [Candidatus Woesearchaeota archaeon]|nr:OB-fold nucleic acid binding domain-containing protein [Candidatus Woesearchaeota archaeon]
MAEKQIAYRTSIKELHELALVEGNEWQPSFLERGNRKISKVNIMGVVVSPEIERQGITIDDGTGSIRAINFNREPKKIVVGQTITVIGRIRTHNGERYISSEIMINSSENM